MHRLLPTPIVMSMVLLVSLPAQAANADPLAAYEEGKFQQALVEFEALAQGGDVQMQSLLAAMLLEGKGVPADPVKAALWFRRAAEQGFAAAQLNLGVLYESGAGITQSFTEAKSWYEKAVEQKFLPAFRNLAGMYAYGRGCTPDPVKAATLWNEAQKAGDTVARDQLIQFLKAHQRVILPRGPSFFAGPSSNTQAVAGVQAGHNAVVLKIQDDWVAIYDVASEQVAWAPKRPR